MKNLSRIFWLHALIVIVMYVVGWFLFERLPAEIPSHWNAAGEVDSYMQKKKFIVFLPSITFFVIILFPILSKIDPRKKNYKFFKRSWLILQTGIVMFFAYLYFVNLYLALNPGKSIEPFMFGGIGVLFILIGNYLGKIRQNYFIGIKTPWTLNNEEVWNKTQRVGGWSFVISGLIIFAEVFLKWQVLPVMIFAVVFASLTPVIYSYFIYRKIEKR